MYTCDSKKRSIAKKTFVNSHWYRTVDLLTVSPLGSLQLISSPFIDYPYDFSHCALGDLFRELKPDPKLLPVGLSTCLDLQNYLNSCWTLSLSLPLRIYLGPLLIRWRH